MVHRLPTSSDPAGYQEKPEIKVLWMRQIKGAN